MKSLAPFVRPPRLAVWLVEWFSPPHQAESVSGDLLEEFAGVASKSGAASARRWYWRQTWRSVPHLFAIGLLGAPWVIAGSVLGSWLLSWAFYLVTQKLVVAALVRYQIYAHIDAFVFWLLYAVLVERVIQPFIVSAIIAASAKGREVVATTTLSLVIALACAAGTVQSLQYRFMSNFRIWPLIFTTFVSPFMVLLGGGIVRMMRCALAPIPSAARF